MKLVLAFALLASPVAAQQACHPSQQFYDSLKQNFGEQRVFMGIQEGYIVELWVSDRGTFTALITRPDGTSCQVSAGDNAQMFPMEPNT